MKHLLNCSIFLCAIYMVSCDQENVIDNLSESSKGAVSFEVPAFVVEEGSRVDVTVNAGSGATCAWGTGDKIGVFGDTMDQGGSWYTVAPHDVGSNKAHFDGGVFELAKNTRYAAYYPYSSTNEYRNNILVNFLGQIQTGNDNTAHIGSYDFIHSGYQETNLYGEVVFRMKHLGALLRFKLTLPETDNFSQLHILNVSGHLPGFLNICHYDLSQNEPVLVKNNVPGGDTNHLYLDLNSVSNSDSNRDIILYAMIAPRDYSSHTWEIRVEGSRTYTTGSFVVGKNFKPGMVYGIAKELH